jgi:hypothetical protein
LQTLASRQSYTLLEAMVCRHKMLDQQLSSDGGTANRRLLTVFPDILAFTLGSDVLFSAASHPLMNESHLIGTR